MDLNHHLLPDPVADVMKSLQKKIEKLESRISYLENELEIKKPGSYVCLEKEERPLCVFIIH